MLGSKRISSNLIWKAFTTINGGVLLKLLMWVINVEDPAHSLLTSSEDIDWRAVTGEARPALELPGWPGHKDSHHLLPGGTGEEGEGGKRREAKMRSGGGEGGEGGSEGNGGRSGSGGDGEAVSKTVGAALSGSHTTLAGSVWWACL